MDFWNPGKQIHMNQLLNNLPQVSEFHWIKAAKSSGSCPQRLPGNRTPAAE
jgi:hypothetical protein